MHGGKLPATFFRDRSVQSFPTCKPHESTWPFRTVIRPTPRVLVEVPFGARFLALDRSLNSSPKLPETSPFSEACLPVIPQGKDGGNHETPSVHADVLPCLDGSVP